MSSPVASNRAKKQTDGNNTSPTKEILRHPTPMTTAPAAAIPTRALMIARDIKLSHSVFALPFALLATFLAAAHAQRLPSVPVFALIVVCMFFARTVAMTINRWADRQLDALNPRTTGRAIPSGRVPEGAMLVAAIACAIVFVIATTGFWWVIANPWPLVLSPAVLAWLCLYSFMKRVTWLCHLFLGAALAISPIAAVIAVEPAYLARPEPYLLAVMVLCWVAGFDVIYALMDVDSDRQTGMQSLPARFGPGKAMMISKLLHAMCVAALISLVIVSEPLGIAFAIGVAAVVVLLVVEHALVAPVACSGAGQAPRRINMAFFTVNGVISVLLGAGGIADVVLFVR
jgi:4-hydroxybenzoate polyprenyltransferase